MAATDYVLAEAFRVAKPHTHNAMTKLLMAMAKMVKSQGRKTWLGKDKGVIAYRGFQEQLRDTIVAMTLDGIITTNQTDQQVSDAIFGQIQQISLIYPNWQEAYQFAALFFKRGEFIDSPFDAPSVVSRLR